jgi:molybdopterin-binding protein
MLRGHNGTFNTEFLRSSMKISARNVIPGKIKSVKKGPITSVVVLEVASGVEIVSTITSDSADSLKLKKGQSAYAIIKASSVMVGTA